MMLCYYEFGNQIEFLQSDSIILTNENLEGVMVDA